MTEWKSGMKVRRFKSAIYPNTYGVMGKIYQLKGESYGNNDWNTEEGVIANPMFFELVPTPLPLYSEEQAVSFLKEKGYNVTPPPEPLKGKAYVFSYKNDDTLVCSSSPWQGHERLGYKLIAIVDWTEGEGI